MADGGIYSVKKLKTEIVSNPALEFFYQARFGSIRYNIKSRNGRQDVGEKHQKSKQEQINSK